MKSEAVKIYWTGGWDSTFRVLQLVLLEKRIIQPHYVIDPDRKSLSNEIKARWEIKQKLFQQHPETKDLFLPTIFSEVSDIPFYPDAQAAFWEYKQTWPCETQYLWLANYCRQKHITDMEIASERDIDSEWGLEYRTFGKFASLIEGTHIYHINPVYKDHPVYQLFGMYTFPIYDYSRQDMQRVAVENGWLDYMALTWFCHYPVHGRYPCGTCLACEQAIEKGQAGRIPWWRRAYARLGLEKLRKWSAGLIKRINPEFHQWKR